MGLYRTKPEEVEAIQFTGAQDRPFDGAIPGWVWTNIATNVLSFVAHGIEIAYNGLSELVTAGDWLVKHNDGIVRACDDKTFRQYYAPARKRTGGHDAVEKTEERLTEGQTADPKRSELVPSSDDGANTATPITTSATQIDDVDAVMAKMSA